MAWKDVNIINSDFNTPLNTRMDNQYNNLIARMESTYNRNLIPRQIALIRMAAGQTVVAMSVNEPCELVYFFVESSVPLDIRPRYSVKLEIDGRVYNQEIFAPYGNVYLTFQDGIFKYVPPTTTIENLQRPLGNVIACKHSMILTVSRLDSVKYAFAIQGAYNSTT